MRPMLVTLLLLSSSAGAASWPWQGCFEVASGLHDVPMEVLLAVATTESALDPDARSNADAHGIMQIQWPGTARHLGVTRLAELYNPCLNIELGARYLRELIDRNDGDLTRALAAYNYGPTRIDRSPELPAGARAYVAKVDAHRDRIERDGAAGAEAMRVAAVAAPIVFDHRARAEAYAAVLNRQVSSVRFEVLSDGPAHHAVHMRLEAAALSLADASRLAALGWTAKAAGS
ncbi:MAG TPA: lytic transglycosylase domain-containing protein [Pseudomonadales bacterium]|nr:lytic transglycosylase domain-containing protein [Pseudomonadales bacterium]